VVCFFLMSQMSLGHAGALWPFLNAQELHLYSPVIRVNFGTTLPPQDPKTFHSPGHPRNSQPSGCFPPTELGGSNLLTLSPSSARSQSQGRTLQAPRPKARHCLPLRLSRKPLSHHPPQFLPGVLFQFSNFMSPCSRTNFPAKETL
jgi:hypothetical protein